MIILALTPPWAVNLDCNVNGCFWLWIVLISGFLTFLYLYTSVSTWLKLFLIWCFASSFLSRAPYISFTMFWSVLFCAYYYALCRKIDRWDYVYKSVQAIFFFVILLVIMQSFGKDTLLNFNMKEAFVMGTIGNKMISASFICTLAPFLIINPINWVALFLIGLISGSSGSILALSMGVVVYLWPKTKKARIGLIIAIISIPFIFALKTGDIDTFKGKAGRRQVWEKTLELSLKQPMGYGIATYKVLFPVMCGKEIRDQQPGREWNTCHNDFLQILFETGFPGTFLLLGWIVSIVMNVKNKLKLAGLMILAGTMSVHFPGRIVESALLIIMFLAYLERGNDAVYSL